MFEKVKKFFTDLTAAAVTITGGMKLAFETEVVFAAGGVVVIILATVRAIFVVAEFILDVMKHVKDKRTVGGTEDNGVADGDGSS